jgi:RNA polymerase sigma factor (TIGR02999 family)
MSDAHPLTTVVYAELRRLADTMMVGERSGHTLEPTALAHEVWLRLLRSRNAHEVDRDAFLGMAAQAMRRILTDHARRRAAARRGGGAHRTTLANVAAASVAPEFVLDLDAALTALESVDVDLARTVELHFYGGCSIEEMARVLATSPRTVKRRWRLARAWLQRHLSEHDHE